ncbi:DUF3558 domain-containing protein [Streptomyces qinzhouensis]|uniref:DUF3558 domain-containing protein n=1 Tax=Streptomyces qinzhouensis TaxID=2599401 RepID=A0A5B8ILL7_9ACTN|nr:DUF3558 domain-containing protein [Streptomyces qinzhouensis]QDY78389.1 DUF3558 domain-containing protein [Streptomyces qinzhouensis]
MHRSAPRLTRILACAALPLLLAVAGCSSDSGDGGGDGGKKETDKAKASGAASTAPEGEGDGSGSGSDPGKPDTVAPAVYTKLPSACGAVTSKSVKDLVPGASPKAGTAGRSADLLARANCHWKGSDDNGLKGTQYRWLDVSFLRYDSEEALKASGEQRAKENYTKEVTKAKTVPGAGSLKSAPAAGIGNEATAVTYTLRKVGSDFTYTAIVSRIDNVVVTLTYNGAGMAGAKSPSIAEISADATKAAKEAVASVGAANKAGGPPASSSKPADGATKKPATGGN